MWLWPILEGCCELKQTEACASTLECYDTKPRTLILALVLEVQSLTVFSAGWGAGCWLYVVGWNCGSTLRNTQWGQGTVWVPRWFGGLRLLVLGCRRVGAHSDLPQEHLLLSILPAYLAREMKAEIMARLQAGQGSRPESTNNFHSLYVKRHQGVRYEKGGWRGGGHRLRP